MVEGIDAARDGLGVLMDQQFDPQIGGGLFAHRVHGAKLPRRVDVQKREGRPGRIEGLLRQMQHDG